MLRISADNAAALIVAGFLHMLIKLNWHLPFEAAMFVIETKKGRTACLPSDGSKFNFAYVNLKVFFASVRPCLASSTSFCANQLSFNLLSLATTRLSARINGLFKLVEFWVDCFRLFCIGHKIGSRVWVWCTRPASVKVDYRIVAAILSSFCIKYSLGFWFDR